MNDFSLEQLEAELRRHKPAEPPSDFLARLLADGAQAEQSSARRQTGSVRYAAWRELWMKLRWWLAPAAVVLLGTLLVLRSHLGSGTFSGHLQPVANVPAVKADDVNIASELVNSFDTVARLPSGEPVRFRCREWIDNVKLRDRARGVMVENRGPRVEVVPVRFETY